MTNIILISGLKLLDYEEELFTVESLEFMGD